MVSDKFSFGLFVPRYAPFSRLQEKIEKSSAEVEIQPILLQNQVFQILFSQMFFFYKNLLN